MTTDGFWKVEASGITFQWKVVGTDLEIKVSAPTTGWVAVGFNPSVMMKDANVIIGYVSAGATLSLQDDYGSELTNHAVDPVSSGTQLIPLGGTEGGGVTEIHFRIPLDSPDDQYDQDLVEGVVTKVILAHGSDGEDNFTQKHQMRTAISVEL